jgi:hypothetical protein
MGLSTAKATPVVARTAAAQNARVNIIFPLL